MRYETWISLRYLKTRRKESFISFNTIISIAGIALGVAALIGVLGVMTGFGSELRNIMVAANPHIIVERSRPIQDYQSLEKTIKGVEGIVATAPYIKSEGVISKEKRVFGVLIKGIDLKKERRVTKLSEYLDSGVTNLGKNEVILGKVLSYLSNAPIEDEVVLISPVNRKQYKLKVKGIFESGMYDYDSHFAFINLETAQEIFGIEGVSGIGAKVSDPYNTKEIKQGLYSLLGFSYLVRDWMDLNKNFLSALVLEKWALFFVVTLVILVAAFNIIGTLIVMVKDKTKDIGILKSIGVTNAGIARIFRLQGLIVGFLGTLIGLGLGFLACYLMKTFIRLPPDVYYLSDKFPILIKWQDLIVICSVTIAISFLATLYPSLKAARLNPVDALRYE